jgi:hypothetical protein
MRARLLPRAIDTDGEPWWAWLLPEWRPVSRGWFVTVTLLCAWLFLELLTDDDGYLLGLDGLNLIVHEGGHFLFVWFGDTAELYGGTLLQLIVPVALALAFVRRREMPGFTLATVWFFQNFLNVARYMADARAQELPLVGGGGHDWFAILASWRLLQYDTRLAGALRAAGWIGMLATYVWFLWRWLQGRGISRAARDAR